MQQPALSRRSLYITTQRELGAGWRKKKVIDHSRNSEKKRTRNGDKRNESRNSSHEKLMKEKKQTNNAKRSKPHKLQ